MLNWLRKVRYRGLVKTNAMALTIMIGNEGETLVKHDAIRVAAVDGFNNNQSPEAAAVTAVAIIMSSVIENMGDQARRAAIYDQLAEWAQSENPRQIRTELREGVSTRDILFLRLSWMLLLAQDWLIQNKIHKHDFAILRSEIYGSLLGTPREVRAIDRARSAINEILS